MCYGTHLANAACRQKQNANFISENASVADELKFNPPIRYGSIVAVRSVDNRPLSGYVGMVVENPAWDPGTRLISIPGIGEVETGLDRCYNATEAERKLYFKQALKHGLE